VATNTGDVKPPGLIMMIHQGSRRPNKIVAGKHDDVRPTTQLVQDVLIARQMVATSTKPDPGTWMIRPIVIVQEMLKVRHIATRSKIPEASQG
jgi:hypothetical protein